jgi:hypothetical protein
VDASNKVILEQQPLHVKLDRLDPDEINRKFYHKHLLIPSSGLHMNIMKKKDLWISRVHEKELQSKLSSNLTNPVHENYNSNLVIESMKGGHKNSFS